MYNVLDAHPLTVMIVIGAFLVTPFYALATYAFSGASLRKGAQIGSVFLLWGALMFWVCLSDTPRALGLPGNLIVPLAWILPSLILIWRKAWFLDRPLSQKWLVGLQLFRVIGGVFLIEMTRGHIPGLFAYPAGIGDILAGLLALVVLVACRRQESIPGPLVLAVAGLGLADFASAFFFGITSSEGPLQLFQPPIANQLISFPTGLIPLFLVPYVIFFHTLSLLNHFKFERS